MSDTPTYKAELDALVAAMRAADAVKLSAHAAGSGDEGALEECYATDASGEYIKINGLDDLTEELISATGHNYYDCDGGYVNVDIDLSTGKAAFDFGTCYTDYTSEEVEVSL